MKFNVPVFTFLSKLSVVIGATDKGSIPVLRHVLIEASQQVVFTATNLDHMLTASFDAEISEPGALLVNAERLFQVLKALSVNAELEVHTDNTALHLKCGRGKWRLQGLPESNFPERQAAQGETVELPSDLLNRAIAAVKYSISKEESRYTLRCIKFEFLPDKVRLITTTGHVMSFTEFNYATGVKKQADLLFPHQSVPLLQSLCSSGTNLNLSLGSNSTHVASADRSLTIRTMSGIFPNWQMVLKLKHPHKAIVAAGDLAATIKRALPLADTGSYGSWGKFTFDNQLLTISGESSEGQGEDALVAPFDGPQVELGFVLKYILEACAVFSGREIAVFVKDGSTQVNIETVEVDDLNTKIIIFPYRLKE